MLSRASGSSSTTSTRTPPSEVAGSRRIPGPASWPTSARLTAGMLAPGMGSSIVKVAPRPGPALSARIDAAVQVHDVPGEHEPEPRPVFHRGQLRALRPLAIEDVRQQLGRDALAGIGDGDHRPVAGAAKRHPDPATVRREADGVREQMPHHLPEARHVAGDDAHRHAEVELDAQTLRLRDRPRGVGRSANDAAQIHRLEIQSHAPQRDARKIQQRIDLMGLQERRMLEPVEGARDYRRLRRLLAQHLYPEPDGVERVAQLVSQRVRELIVEPIGSFGGKPRAPLALQLFAEVVCFRLGMGAHAGDHQHIACRGSPG